MKPSTMSTWILLNICMTTNDMVYYNSKGGIIMSKKQQAISSKRTCPVLKYLKDIKKACRA